MDKTSYQIDEVAVKTGLTKRALRYYEDLNLITPLRTGSGYRLYSEEDVAIILHIKEIRESLGFCLNDIKEILELSQNLKDIFTHKTSDLAFIEKSLAMMKKQMALAEIKEQSLAKVVAKYQKAFNDLNQFYLTLKEGTKNDEED